MDVSSLILKTEVSSAAQLGNMKNPNDAMASQKVEFAKNFESVFIGKLLDEMKKTVVNWDGEKDAATEQMNGIFWMHLADEMGDQGGLGMWKDIYKSLNASENTNNVTESLDHSA